MHRGRGPGVARSLLRLIISDFFVSYYNNLEGSALWEPAELGERGLALEQPLVLLLVHHCNKGHDENEVIPLTLWRR